MRRPHDRSRQRGGATNTGARGRVRWYSEHRGQSADGSRKNRKLAREAPREVRYRRRYDRRLGGIAIFRGRPGRAEVSSTAAGSSPAATSVSCGGVPSDRSSRYREASRDFVTEAANQV